MGANFYLHILPTPLTLPLILFFIYPKDNLSSPTPNLPTLTRVTYHTYPYIVTSFSKIYILNVFSPYTSTLTHRVFTYSENQSFWNPPKFSVFAKVQTFHFIQTYIWSVNTSQSVECGNGRYPWDCSRCTHWHRLGLPPT